jgi:hypothetical protein
MMTTFVVGKAHSERRVDTRSAIDPAPCISMMRNGTTVLTASAIAALAAATYATLPRGYAAGRILVAQDDPVRLADVLLEGRFDVPCAAREIEAALASGDTELAASFLELGRERGVSLDPVLVAKVDAARQASQSTTHQLASFARGFFTGVPDSLAGFAGTAFGDLFLFGDLRDAAREGARAVQGQEADKVILGLSLAGIAVSAGTYASLGAGAPARVGLSLLKAASKGKRLGAGVLGMVRTETLVRVAGNLGRVQARAGTRAAVEGLKLAEGPKDVQRLARLAEGEGTKTRAVMKLLGRGAMVLTSGAFELASWVFWAITNLLALCVALKRGAERATLAIIRYRKSRRRAAFRSLAA